MSIDELGKELRELRSQRGLSQQALATRAGISRNFIAQIERAESIPTVATLSRLATALGTTVAELLGEETTLHATDIDAIAVPLVADRIAAGPPMVVADHVERYEPLPRALLKNLGVDLGRAVLVRLGADQDSMADTIPPGATVLVDRTPVREIVPKAIYAVREESAGETGCSVKRLVVDHASRVLILLSDNPAHHPRAIRLRADQSLADIVVGRVIWWIPPNPPHH
jgi:transcriptional regulator with XRE-family HTH domain